MVTCCLHYLYAIETPPREPKERVIMKEVCGQRPQAKKQMHELIGQIRMMFG